MYIYIYTHRYRAGEVRFEGVIGNEGLTLETWGAVDTGGEPGHSPYIYVYNICINMYLSISDGRG